MLVIHSSVLASLCGQCVFAVICQIAIECHINDVYLWCLQNVCTVSREYRQRKIGVDYWALLQHNQLKHSQLPTLGLSVCLSVCLSVTFASQLSLTAPVFYIVLHWLVCLSICPSICLSVSVLSFTHLVILLILILLMLQLGSQKKR